MKHWKEIYILNYGKLSILLILLLECQSPNLINVSKEYTQIVGKLSAPPSLEAANSRLFIYVLVKSEVENKEELVVCLATNREARTILSELREKLLAAAGEPIFLYVTKSSGNHEEIISGIDYDVYAVGVYIPESKKYRIVLTSYGEGLRAALSNISWQTFLQKILEKSIKTAF